MKRHAVVAVLTLAITLPPSLVRAADPPAAAQIEAARKHHQAGTKLFNETDFAGALVEFQRAHEIAPNWRVLFDVAQSYYQLQNYAAALETFERYLAEGEEDIPAARRQIVEAEIAELTKRVAQVSISVSAPGAEIVVDDQVLGVSPLAGPVRISAGRRKVRARKTGMIADERTIDVAGGDKLELTLKLTPSQTVVQMHSEGRPLFWGLAVGTGVLAVGTGVFGALTLVASNDWKRTRDSSNLTADQQSSAIDKTKAYALTTDVLGGLTLIAGVATAVVYFKTRRDSAIERPAQPVVGVGPGSVHVLMKF
jgi:hypothetical protein